MATVTTLTERAEAIRDRAHTLTMRFGELAAVRPHAGKEPAAHAKARDALTQETVAAAVDGAVLLLIAACSIAASLESLANRHGGPSF